LSAPQSPARRVRRFRSNRLGYVSLLVFAVLFGVSLMPSWCPTTKPACRRYNAIGPSVDRDDARNGLWQRLSRPTDCFSPSASFEKTWRNPAHFAALIRYDQITLRENPDPSPPNPELVRHRRPGARSARAVLYGFRLSSSLR